MFLQRCRYLRAKVALQAWRIDHSVPVLQCLRGAILRQKTIEIGLQSVRYTALFHYVYASTVCVLLWTELQGTLEF